MLALVLLAVLLAGVGSSIRAGACLDARRYPPPGQRVAVPGGRHLHVYEQGSPSAPAVVFEAGISGSCLSWSTVQPLVAQLRSFSRAL